MGQSIRASEKGLAIANQARQRRGWTKTSTARWWQDAHTSRATLRRFWRGERIQQEAFIAICHTIGIDTWQDIAELSFAPIAEPSWQLEPKPGNVDWGEAPDIEQFYGREPELEQLQTWIVTETAKLINISGPGGHGKTALALALAEQLQTEFESIIWRSMDRPLEALLTDLLDGRPIETVDQGVRQLLQTMQNRRLIILDDLDETQIQTYLDPLYRISRSRHGSCLLVISRQPLPPQFHTLNRAYHLPLAGLSADAATQLLAAHGCGGQTYQLKNLARIYSYNPLALKLVVATIQTVFRGQTAAFLEQEIIILPDPIRLLCQQQFETLEPLEKTLLFWLAIWQEPISLCRLQTHLLNPDPAGVIKALSYLVEHSLITQHFLTEEPLFGLQPMVMTFAMEHLVAAITQELSQAEQQQTIQCFQLLRTHCLIRPGTDDILGDRVLTALLETYQQLGTQPLSALIETWLQQTKQEPSSTVGYLMFNLAILRHGILMEF
ncbi:NB-ARC domain-containing protein [Leptothoe sp. PORK10 BA2]|uniref:NB-ARC domain-containing protein n=1 Tax=Leptothoe sp. PORK10 BA2 TaxID=3110254 RepID=UPI002B1EE01B|nr:NB-ARC domain-containing protein [Leptothoe sp. PORK10 BA2]MEA5465687.1 NB-ARC domain-containing protein [Leptothoe sp. PORK10 BA2]